MKVQISGIVIDNDGEPVAGATVESQGAGWTTTGLDGRFSLWPIQTVPGSTLWVLTRGDMCLASGASVNVTPDATEYQVEIKVTRRYPLPIDGTDAATLKPSDPPAEIFGWDDPLSSWQTRYYMVTTPVDAAVRVELSWERVGGAELMMWTYDGGLISAREGDRQVFTLVKNRTDVLYVVQPTQAGPLTQPVRFTLTTQTIR